MALSWSVDRALRKASHRGCGQSVLYIREKREGYIRIQETSRWAKSRNKSKQDFMKCIEDKYDWAVRFTLCRLIVVVYMNLNWCDATFILIVTIARLSLPSNFPTKLNNLMYFGMFKILRVFSRFIVFNTYAVINLIEKRYKRHEY